MIGLDSTCTKTSVNKDSKVLFQFGFHHKKRNPIKRKLYKMVRHTQTIRRLQPTNCLSVFDPFVGLALKGLKSFKSILNRTFKSKVQYKVIQLNSCCLGSFEISIMVRASFISNGEPLPCINKVKLIHLM